jgi:protein-S-isoprenylcysteine O-methyltransferase Ste14
VILLDADAPAVAALGLYVVWFGLAFVGRMLLQLRRTGDSGWRAISAPLGSADGVARGLFVLGLALGAAAPIAHLADLSPVEILDNGWLKAFGLVCAVVGVGATVIAQLAMGSSWRVGVDERERTELVTDGPFAWMRNPIYSAMLAAALGLALLVPNILALSGLAVLVIALELQVRLVEERHLLSVHGSAYVRYASDVGRFVPGLGRLRQPRS